MPFLQTTTAAASRGMLGHKHRVTTKWRLLAIIGQAGWGQALGDKVTRMIQHQRQALGLQIRLILEVELEAAAKA